MIVGEESCIGERGNQNLVDDSGSTVEALMDAIVERYFKIDCAIFTPNESRLEHVKTMVKKIPCRRCYPLCSCKFCSPYVIESYPVEQHWIVDDIPAIRIETDYSQKDIGQLKTRVEAFIETLK